MNVQDVPAVAVAGATSLLAGAGIAAATGRGGVLVVAGLAAGAATVLWRSVSGPGRPAAAGLGFDPCDACACLDHIIPHSRFDPRAVGWPVDDPRNLVTGCWECNLSKGNRTPAEWADGRRVISRGRDRLTIPEELRQAIYQRDGWRCGGALGAPYCGRPVHPAGQHSTPAPVLP